MGMQIDITNISLGEIDRLELSSWLVDLDAQRVTAWIGEVNTDGDRVREFEVSCWATIPDEIEVFDEDGLPTGETIPNPDTWYELPTGVITELVGLSDQVLIAVKGRLYS